MNRWIAPGLIVICFLFLMGMGELGGTAGPVEKIPVPEKNFSVGVLDRDGVHTALQSFSFAGKVFLAGKYGSGEVTIPFEKIAEIQFQGQEGSEIVVKVLLRDQKSVLVKIDKQAKFFGKTDFGSYQIEAKGLKSIRF